jgi:hypothetical protein
MKEAKKEIFQYIDERSKEIAANTKNPERSYKIVKPILTAYYKAEPK